MTSSGDTGTTWLKELVTAVMALTTLVALLMTYRSLSSMPEGDAISDGLRVRMANTEKVGTALFGIFAAFVGYYAGRIPAERSAAAAQQAAAATQRVADLRTAQARQVVGVLAATRERIAHPHATAAGAGDPLLEQIDRVLGADWS